MHTAKNKKPGKWSTLICMGCGNEFSRVNAHVRRGKGKFQYHSLECYYKDPVLRRCKQCGEVKPVEVFEKQGTSRRTGRQYYRPRCKLCDAPLKKNWQAKRKSRSKQVNSTFTPEQWEITLRTFGKRCGYCGVALGQKFVHQDHFVPLVRRGPYEMGNIVPACQKCNCSKHDKRPEEWLRQEDFSRVLSILNSLRELSLINGENLNARAQGNPQQASESRAAATTE